MQLVTASPSILRHPPYHTMQTAVMHQQQLGCGYVLRPPMSSPVKLSSPDLVPPPLPKVFSSSPRVLANISSPAHAPSSPPLSKVTLPSPPSTRSSPRTKVMTSKAAPLPHVDSPDSSQELNHQDHVHLMFGVGNQEQDNWEQGNQERPSCEFALPIPSNKVNSQKHCHHDFFILTDIMPKRPRTLLTSVGDFLHLM